MAEIKALTDHEFLKARTNIYFGGETGSEEHPYSSQKSVVIREIIDNAVDAVKKQAKDKDKIKGIIRVSFFKDGKIEVTDSGGGIPIEANKTADGKKTTSVYLALGELRTGSNYNSKETSLGTNGVGGAGTAILSSRFDVTVFRGKKQYQISFKDGNLGEFDGEGPEAPFRPIKDITHLKVSPDKRSKEEKAKFGDGTKIEFWINHENFRVPYEPDYDELIDRMRNTCFILPGLTIEVYNEHTKNEDGSPEEETFHFEKGIEELVNLNLSEKRLSPTILLRGETGFKDRGKDSFIEAELAFAYEDSFDYTPSSFVNTINTRIGGVHELAFERALTKVFSKKFRSIRGLLTAKDQDPNFSDFSEGLSVVISVYLPEPQFQSQIKDELTGADTQKALQSIFETILGEWTANPNHLEIIKNIAGKVLLATKNRLLAREQKELKKVAREVTKSTKMPEKLVDCKKTYTPESELYICEGDSALGALKSGRDAENQALLPIRGKIINAHKEGMTKVLKNQEVQDIITCLDAGIKDKFCLDKARYQRIFIATDQDTDGGSIATLIFALFWHLFPEVIEKGQLYKINTPLFIVKSGKERYYAASDLEKEKILKKLKGKSYTILRAKGLGELDSLTLHQTGMDRDSRALTKISLGDKKEAKEMLDITLGKDVELRRSWIENNPLENISE